MLINIELGQRADINLELVFLWKITGQLIIQTVNPFDNKNVILT